MASHLLQLNRRSSGRDSRNNMGNLRGTKYSTDQLMWYCAVLMSERHWAGTAYAFAPTYCTLSITTLQRCTLSLTMM